MDVLVRAPHDDRVVRSTGNCDSSAIIALGFSAVNGASYQGPVFAKTLAPSGAKHHSLRDDDWRGPDAKRSFANNGHRANPQPKPK